MADLYDQLISRLDFADSDAWAKADPVERVLIASHEVTGALLAVYQPLRGTSIDRAEVAAAITRVYDEKIAPLDIPNVGPFIEGFLDRSGAVIGEAVVTGLDALLDKYVPKPLIGEQ